MDNLDKFYPERIASRMLGMGDIQTLVEHAQEKIKKNRAERGGGFNRLAERFEAKKPVTHPRLGWV